MAFGRLERTTGPQPMSDINMTPLIDVMLVLLVIFMITAPLMTSSLKLDLPKTDGAQLHFQRRVGAAQLGHALLEGGGVQHLVAQAQGAVGGDRHRQEAGRVTGRGGLALGQVQAQRGGHQRGGDHEDHQQHQHHVDQRGHVDLAHRA